MKKIYINVCEYPILGESVSAVLIKNGYEDADINIEVAEAGKLSGCKIFVSDSEKSRNTREKIAGLLQPIELELIDKPICEDADIQIQLAPQADYSRPGSIEWWAEGKTAENLNDIFELLELSHMPPDKDATGFYTPCNYILHRDVDIFTIQLICFMVRAGVGCELEMVHVDHGTMSTDIVVVITEPVKDWYQVPMVIHTDDMDFILPLIEKLKESGFTNVTANKYGEDEPCHPDIDPKKFEFYPGPFIDNTKIREDVFGCVKSFMTEFFDVDDYPLHAIMKDELDEAGIGLMMDTCHISLPVKACSDGGLNPILHRKDIEIIVHSEDKEDCDALVSELVNAGFDNIAWHDIEDWQGYIRGEGFYIEYHDTVAESFDYKQTIHDIVSENIPEGKELRFSLEENTIPEELAEKKNRVCIRFPVKSAETGELEEQILNLSNYSLTIEHSLSDGPVIADLIEDLEGFGLTNISVRTEDCSGFELKATQKVPAQITLKIESIIRTWFDDLQDIKLEYSDDLILNDMVLTIPPLQTMHKKTSVAGKDEKPDEGTCVYEKRPFVEQLKDKLRIGNIYLTVNKTEHHLIPPISDFSRFCIDSRTGETLLHVAESVALREPCLLEGETSTSKTSTILYLAALIKQPVVRINLNGQTDTGELIGRFVPDHLTRELPVKTSELEASEDFLETETRLILDRAESEGRPLSQFEIHQIIDNEGIQTHPWRWQDGLLPQAMRNGWWVLLDEINLAEPQILERLNSVLENNPSLVITENDNSIIGPCGTQVHDNFRIFATMNPAEYAGRSTLSPAFLDRWRGYRHVPRPGANEYQQMLSFLATGQQPEVIIEQTRWQSSVTRPAYPQLQEFSEFEYFTRLLADFHSSLEAATGQNGEAASLGTHRKEQYVFSRRSLISIMDYMASPRGVDGKEIEESARRALDRYYIQRVAAEDRKTVIQLMDAVGLGPNNWVIGVSMVTGTIEIEAEEKLEKQRLVQILKRYLDLHYHELQALIKSVNKENRQFRVGPIHCSEKTWQKIVSDMKNNKSLLRRVDEII